LLHAEEPKHPLLRYQNIDIMITTLVFKLGILSAPATPSTPHCYHATCLRCSNFSPRQRARMFRMRIREVSHSHNRQNRTSTERCSRLGEQGQDVASRLLRDCSLGRFCRRPCGVRKKGKHDRIEMLGSTLLPHTFAFHRKLTVAARAGYPPSLQHAPLSETPGVDRSATRSAKRQSISPS
jgi:hypothetical protein